MTVTFGEFDGLDYVDRVVHVDAVICSCLDYVPDAFFEEGAVDDERVGVANECDLLG